MAFVTKTWKDRLVEYAGRRKLKNVATGEEILMDVSRSEGTVNQAGDAFSAANMNNLEQRIKTEFDSVNSSLQDSNTSESFNFGSLNGVRGFFTNPSKADDSFVPFSKSFISINQFKSSMISTHYYVGFKPRLVVCGVNAEAAFEWYYADTNKHYYNANTSKPYNLGQFSLQSVYAFDSIDDTGFTFRVGQSTYKNLNLIIFAIG